MSAFDYKALAERVAQRAIYADNNADQNNKTWAADLRAIVSLLNGMADAQPVANLYYATSPHGGRRLAIADPMSPQMGQFAVYTHPAPAVPQAEEIDPHMLAAEDRFPDEQAEPKREPNPDEVICPACTHQFRAIPENVQAQLWAKRAPLDDHEISKLAWQQNLWTDGLIEFSFLAFARAVERAHGISGGGHD